MNLRPTKTPTTKKRGGLDIFKTILANLTEGQLDKKHLIHKVNLDSSLTMKYMETLVKFGLVTKSTREDSYFIITEKGQDFLKELV